MIELSIVLAAINFLGARISAASLLEQRMATPLTTYRIDMVGLSSD